MADTYGYNEDGTKKFDPGKYDQWGVYMGSRGADVKAAKTGAMQSTKGNSLWESDLPFEEWLPKYAATMLARNSQGGLTPVTAAQGTQEYRDQVAKNEADARIIAGWGGTTGNMGVHNQKGAGLNMFNQYKDNQAGQIADWAKARALKAYNNRAEMAKKLPWNREAAAAAPTEETTGDGSPDMWPGATGQEGSLPSYAAPQYNPVDSWGGWSGVYGNNTGAPANPAGLGQAPLAMPASSSGLGNPANSTPATGGLQAPASVPGPLATGTMNTGSSVPGVPGGYDGSGINPQGQPSKPMGSGLAKKPMTGYNGSGYNPTMGQSMMRPNRRRNTGVSGLGAPTTLGVVPG